MTPAKKEQLDRSIIDLILAALFLILFMFRLLFFDTLHEAA